jgi:hypothetical protein
VDVPRSDHVEMAARLPLAFTREALRAQVNRAEMMLIESQARAAGLSVGNYVRSLLGLPERAAAGRRAPRWRQSRTIRGTCSNRWALSGAVLPRRRVHCDGLPHCLALDAVLGYPSPHMSSPSSPLVSRTALEKADSSSLLREIVEFHEDCNRRYRFNSRWDNVLNAGGLLLSVCIIAAGVRNRSDISTILGGLVAAIVTAQRAFPFGQRAIFYRVLIGKARNLQTDLANSLVTGDAAANLLKALRLDYARQLPLGSGLQEHQASPPTTSMTA